MRYSTVLICALVTVMASCSKQNGGSGSTRVRDTVGPSITIISPGAGQGFGAGQTIQTKASATDNVKVTELHIHVKDKNTGALLRDIHSYPDAAQGTVEDAFTAQSGMSYTIQVIANDPSQNLTTSQVDVVVN